VTTIEVPDPSLVLLVGAAGAGKTTFAARHFAPDEVLSSDAYRALLSGDEANQKVSRVAFSILHRDLERRLRAGHLAVVDATNVEPRNRRELIRRAHAAGLPVVALVLDLHPAIVLARNATRPRQVDEAVIRSQLERVRTTGRALARMEELAAREAGDREVDVAVQHLAAPERAGEVAQRLRARLPKARSMYVGEVGAVVGAHVGPGMLGVVVAPAS